MEIPGLAPVPDWEPEETHRERRTAAHWLRSAIRYCDWRADAYSGRWNPNRLHYLNGRAVLADLLSGRSHARELQLLLPPMAPKLPSASCLPRFSGRSRASMAEELVAVDPHYTDRKLLAGLPASKLAALLAAAVERAEAAAPEKRRA
jgi:hypothetical protein